MRGRRPIPTAIKMLKGNPGRRPLNDREPHHPDVDPTVPAALKDPKAIEEWERVIGTLSQGHVMTVDRATLITYCLKWAQWQNLEAEAAVHPSIVKAPSGAPIPNPLVGMANRACALMLKAAGELGITPASRSRIVLTDEGLAHRSTPRGPIDEFTAFQRQRKRGA